MEKKGENNGFVVETSAGMLEASNVVISTGTFQKPKIPEFAQSVAPEVIQLHSSRYQNPDKLPPGAVLVVGSGQSGSQIAEELYQSGRKVYLSTGKNRRVPRRYRGKDFTWWLKQSGFTGRTVDMLESPKDRFVANPQLTGKNGGHTLNLHRFAKEGVILLGYIKSAGGTKVEFKDDLKENLAAMDKFENEFKKGIDQFIEKTGFDAPVDDSEELKDGYDSEIIEELDLESADIKSIVWATGYKWDFSWIKLPVFDEFGYPKQERGVTSFPGLYFIGLHWLHTIESGLLSGVGEDAEHIVSQIPGRKSD